MSVIETFIRASNAAATEDDVFACFSKALRGLGFDVEYYFFPSDTAQAAHKPFRALFSTAPALIIDMYVSHRLEKVNITHNLARASGQVTPWFKSPSNMDIDPNYAAFRHESQQTGLTSGFAIPVFGPGTEIAYVDIGTYKSKGKIDLSSEEVQIARLLSYQLHDRMKALLQEERALPVLSAREKEALQWVMAGKSDTVIGELMNISEHTVNTYLKRCYQKLGVANRIAAVVKALAYGLITP